MPSLEQELPSFETSKLASPLWVFRQNLWEEIDVAVHTATSDSPLVHFPRRR